MNLRIVKNTTGSFCEKLKDGLVLEKNFVPSDYNNVKAIKLYLYNLETNSKDEIAPRVKKFDVATITNLNTESDCIYYCSCMTLLSGKTAISLVKYDYKKDLSETVYMYEDDIEQYNGFKRVRFFVVNDYYIIVQNEYLRSNYTDTYEGYLDFEVYLYSVKDEKKIEIFDENLVNNGIAYFMPVTETLAVLKTGFSLLKDARYKYLEKNETSVEGLALINPSQLVSDIMLMKKTIVYDTMEQTYFKSTIPFVDIKGNYVIYSKVNLENHEEEIIFYNYKNKKSTSCINRNVFEEKDLAKYYLIDRMPYIRLDGKEKTEFYNLVKNKIDISFDKSETIAGVANNLIVTSSVKKSFFTGETPVVKLFRYPDLSIMHREKAIYRDCISFNEDDIYILVK